MAKKSNITEFIEKAKLVHGDYYDYSLVDYKGTKDKISIICPNHGIFIQKINEALIARFKEVLKQFFHSI